MMLKVRIIYSVDRIFLEDQLDHASDFIEENERVDLVKKKVAEISKSRFRNLRCISKITMTTDESMSLTRADK